MSALSISLSNFIEKTIAKDLEGGKYGSVQTRFPPEPNGFLHLGHAKSICLNFGIAQKFGGKCNLRFDDTNPLTEEQIYIDAIQEDVRWLGFAWDRLCYASDYFEWFYDCAIRLIEKGLAYVDESSIEKLREDRGNFTLPGENSPFRDRPIAVNLACFRKMRAGQYAEGSAVLRAKIDMSSAYIVLRDPILYRIKFATHHQTGDRWCIYPMYDFAHCLSDAAEQVSHSICTLEFQDNRRLYDWILDHLDLPRRPYQYEFARLELEGTILSKRQLNRLVEEKWVTGWDDPRMPTLSGLRKRGYPAAAIRSFCERIGVSKQNSQIEQNALETCVREYLNAHAPRAMGVLKPLKLVLDNWPAETIEELTLPLLQIEGMGNSAREVLFGREIYISQDDFREEGVPGYKRLVLGGIVRLRHAYIVRAEWIERNERGEISAVHCQCDRLTLGRQPGDGIKPKGVIHWVSAAGSKPAEFRLYGCLLRTGAPPDEAAGQVTEGSFNPQSCIILQGLVENSVDPQSCQVYQFEREGYFCVDPDLTTSRCMVLHQTATLREPGKPR